MGNHSPLVSLAKNGDCFGSAAVITDSGNSLASPRKAPFLAQRYGAEVETPAQGAQDSQTQGAVSLESAPQVGQQGGTQDSQSGKALPQEIPTTPQSEQLGGEVTANSTPQGETTRSGKILELESGLYERGARSYLSGNDAAPSEIIADSSPKANAEKKAFGRVWKSN